MTKFLSGFFGHPEFWIISAALISVPIIIHMINRLRFKRVRWAAMEFLLKAQKRNRRRLVVEQLLLLALRCLLVALVGLLVMRFTAVSFKEWGIQKSLHIVLLDDSLSMNDRTKTAEGYVTCFDLAKKDILLEKIVAKVSQSKAPETLILLPLSSAQSDNILSKKAALTADDAQDGKFGSSGGRMKTFPVQLEAGSSYSIKLGSSAFNAYLRLLGPGDQVLAEDDDSGGGTNARIQFSAESAGKYKLVAASVDDKVGSFQIDVFKELPPKTYNLTEGYDKDKITKDISELQPTKLYLNLLDGVRLARKLADENPQTMITLHVLSDFRKRDWGSEDSANLHKELADFAKSKAQIRLIDTVVEPARSLSMGAPVPPAHDNIGIVSLKPRSRMVGKNMPVTFTLNVANYGPDADNVKIVIYEHTPRGLANRHDEIDFIPPLSSLKLKSREITQVTFEMRFDPKLEDNGSYFAAIAAHLESPILEKDGLPQDNVAYGVVEVREQVPVLVIDGEGEAGYKDRNKGRDSFFLNQAYRSVPGASKGDDDEGGIEPVRPYRVDLPYKWKNEKDKDGNLIQKAVADSMAALDVADLRQYPTIVLANVPSLTDSQLKNLEKYVEEGGGLAIFLGPKVSPEFYNDKMYNNGKGLFPVSLRETYFPAAKKEGLKPRYQKGVPMLMLRDDNTRVKPFPIFDAIFTAPEQRELLEKLPIHRYFQAKSRPDENSDRDGRHVIELATLPNNLPIDTYTNEVMNIVRKSGEKGEGKLTKLADLLAEPEYRKYTAALEPHRTALQNLVEVPIQSPHFLAVALEKMLKDRGTGGKDSVSLEDFWNSSDQKVKDLRSEIDGLVKRVRYGDPFIFASTYGKGKVVTVMSTAGSLWHDWGGGTEGAATYQPFIWEMQNYLSGQGSDVNLTLGKRLELKVDAPLLDPKRPVEMFRTLLKIEVESEEARALKAKNEVKNKKQGETKVEQKTKEQSNNRLADKGQKGTLHDNVFTFVYPSTGEPGVYLTELFYAGDKDLLDKQEAAAARARDKGQPTEDKDKPKKKIRPISSAVSVFNVDTIQESNLERVGYDVIKINILDKSDKRAEFTGSDVTSTSLVPSLKDLSESPLLFLLFLGILVAEQALAVHLSFHIKGNEVFAPAGQARPPVA